MIKSTVNNQYETEMELASDQPYNGIVNGKALDLDVTMIKPGTYSVINNHQSYTVEVLNPNHQEKTYEITVNGNKYHVALEDEYDALLKQLGMDNLSNMKVKEVKAPMPGLVIDVVVNPGTEVKKGDPLLILEAMKMENILKSPTDGVVKSIAAVKSATVEKNEVLIHFE